MDPVLHAEMALLVQREKKLEEERKTLLEEITLWRRRVELAKDKGMTDLAGEASERVKQLAERGRAVDLELDVIEMDKSMLRKQSRRPDGREVERAEALLESFRQGGLVDPDEASLEREFRELAAGVDKSSGEE